MLMLNRVLMNTAGDGGAGGGGAGGSGGAGGAGAGTPWYQGVAGYDAEVVGHLTNKGWHNKSAPEVALEALKAYKAAEHFVGVPSDQLLRFPKDASDEAGWAAIHQRLGMPKEAKDYDFSGVKFSDGTALDEGFSNFMREQAFRNKLSKSAAEGLTAEFAKFLDGIDQRQVADQTAKLAEQRAELVKNWGANFEANKFIAQRAAQALGVEPETVAALESQIGYAKIMEMFRAIGSKIGEDKFITGGQPGSGGVMTRDQAVARKADLMKDQGWVKRYMGGDSEARREMTALNTIIVGTQ